MHKKLVYLFRHPFQVLLLSFSLTCLLLGLVLLLTTDNQVEEEPLPSFEEVQAVLHFSDFYSDLIPPIAPPPEWESYTFQPNDRLSSLWQRRFNLSINVLYQLLQSTEGGRHLDRIRPGQTLEWLVTRDGQLLSLRLWRSDVHALEWNRDGRVYQFREYQLERDVTYLRLEGHLQGTLSDALMGVPEIAAHRGLLAASLDRYLPLRRQARDGDRFTLLIEQEWVNGQDTPYATRLQAFIYDGDRVNVVAARHLDGRFYTPEGESLIPPFDRIPLQRRYRISDPFNPQRLHPVLGVVRPHWGTDFATPVGTPVVAPADGVVVRRGRDRSSGNFLWIDHGQGYQTRYLHLRNNHLFVSQGQSVRRGQVIAQTGNTGLSTGPHLHYELRINGRPVDAMRAELPSVERLTGDDLQRFQAHTQRFFADLQDESMTSIGLNP